MSTNLRYLIISRKSSSQTHFKSPPVEGSIHTYVTETRLDPNEAQQQLHGTALRLFFTLSRSCYISLSGSAQNWLKNANIQEFISGKERLGL